MLIESNYLQKSISFAGDNKNPTLFAGENKGTKKKHEENTKMTDGRREMAFGERRKYTYLIKKIQQSVTLANAINKKK